MKAIAKLIHIPLREAYLCSDCQSVGNSSAWCPSCASTAVYPLVKLLERSGVTKPRSANA